MMILTEITSQHDDCKVYELRIPRAILETIDKKDFDWVAHQEHLNGRISDALFTLHKLAEAVESLQPSVNWTQTDG